jgi:hypothetical protein
LLLLSYLLCKHNSRDSPRRSVSFREIEVALNEFPNGTVVNTRELLFQKEGFVVTIAFIISNLI